jgi:alpha-glucosidase
MKKLILSIILVLCSCITFSQPHSEMIGDNIAVFYPDAFDSTGTLPSLALLAEPAVVGPVPVDWAVTPEFFIEEGKNCARIYTEVGTDLYGTGEVTGSLRRNETQVTLWNTDNYGYGTDNGKRLYQSHPWVLAVRSDGSSYGILIDHSWKQSIILGNPIKIISEGPPFRIIIIERDSPQEVLTALAGLIGTIPLPPIWALGYHQCRFSYYPDSQVRQIADTFREKNIPCDVIWMDIDYMNGYRVFTFDPVGFPDPPGLNAYLHSKGFKSIWMIDPGVKKDNSYFIYNSGSAGNQWVYNSAGNPYYGDVWPGSCAFPDFTRPETRNWWANLYPAFMANGIDGIWNDMNEPALFNEASKTMPVTNIHRGGGGLPQDVHLRYHNVYGMLMVEATRQGMQQAQPAKRPFVLTRASFLGGQRFAATWTGDNVSNWNHLKMSIPMVLNLGLSGQPFSGPDIGGYIGSPGAELLGQWMAVGAFYPFCRNHSGKGTDQQEPWAYGEQIETVSRTALERRYRLLPYLYTLFYQSSQTGMPVMQPAFFADVTDLSLRKEEQAFLLGEKLMIVPQWADSPFLPDGNWRKIYLISESLENDGYQPDLRLKAGSILPLGQIIQSTATYSTDSITLLISPDDQLTASGNLYNDAGDGYGYQAGEYAITYFQASPTMDDSLLVTCLQTEGSWDTVSRLYRTGLVTNYGTFYSDWKSDSIFKIPLYPDLYVKITSPANGTHFRPNDNILLQAMVSGNLVSEKVAFYYNETTLISEDTDAPYEVDWQNVPAGDYEVKAVAYTNFDLQISSVPVGIKAGYFGDGFILREVWYNIEGAEVFNLTDNANYPDHPDETGMITSFEAPSNVGDNYGSRIIGYVHPPVSANYTFYVSGDDYCELWLGTDSTQASRQMIAEVPGYTNLEQWDKYPGQKSVSISLDAGRKYFIMALQKEAANDDHLEVAWEFTGTSREVIPGDYLSPYDFPSSVPVIPDNFVTVHIYPNPATDKVTISLSNLEGGKIDICSLTGISLKELMIEKGRHSANISLSGLSSGIYLVRIQTGNTMINRKILLYHE